MTDRQTCRDRQTDGLRANDAYVCQLTVCDPINGYVRNKYWGKRNKTKTKQQQFSKIAVPVLVRLITSYTIYKLTACPGPSFMKSPVQT